MVLVFDSSGILYLKEVIESDAQPVTATHTYLYNSAGRLTSYTGKQSFSVIFSR